MKTLLSLLALAVVSFSQLVMAAPLDESTQLTSKLIPLECDAIIWANSQQCRSPDCTAIVQHNTALCKTLECVAIIDHNVQQCRSWECKAVVEQNSNLCRSNICLAIVQKNSSLCYSTKQMIFGPEQPKY